MYTYEKKDHGITVTGFDGTVNFLNVPEAIDGVAVTAIAPGDDCASAVRSSISSSRSHPSSSTNFFFISDTMTKPPPNVTALIYSIFRNSPRSKGFVRLSFA